LRDKTLNEREIWKRIREVLQTEIIPHRKIYEVPLPSLGYLIFRNADFDDLKGWNRFLAHVLRKHKIKIIRKQGRRYALIPERILRKKKTKIEVEEVWRWP